MDKARLSISQHNRRSFHMGKTRKRQGAATSRSLPDLPNELFGAIAGFLDEDDFSTIASLALTCRETYPFFNQELYKRDARSKDPRALAWGALTGNLNCIQHAMAMGTHVDLIFRIYPFYYKQKSKFQRELQSHTCGLYQTDTWTLKRHTENDDECNTAWGTPLHFATVANQPEAAELLLKSGASLQGPSFGLCSVARLGHSCVHSLESPAKKFFPMHTAVCHGHKEMIELFLRHGDTTFNIVDNAEANEFAFWVDPDEPEGLEKMPAAPHATALHIAASVGRIDLVEMFARDSYISVNNIDCDGRSPLHYAALGILKQPRALVRKLVQLGAYLDAQNKTDYELLVRCIAEGRCAVAIDLLQLRAYRENFTKNQLGNLVHAAITPAALYTEEVGISIDNLRSARYTRYSVLLHRKFRGDESAWKDRDSTEREELVRLLTKDYGVNINTMLPSIPETPITLVARCNASSSSMLRVLLLELGADITIPNGNGDTAVHCAMRLYAHKWVDLNQHQSYQLDLGHNMNGDDSLMGDSGGVGQCPDSVLCSLVSCWPDKEIRTVQSGRKGATSVWDCIFASIHWKDRRYLDLATAVDPWNRPYGLNKTVTPADKNKSMPVTRVEKLHRVEFVETLLGGRSRSYDAIRGSDYKQAGPWTGLFQREATAELNEIRQRLRLPPRKWDE